MASLQGVVDEWDASDIVRNRLRDQRLLILPLPHMDKAHVNQECGEHNFDALAPLVKRLQYPEGVVSMHALPHIQHQFFGWHSLHFTFDGRSKKYQKRKNLSKKSAVISSSLCFVLSPNPESPK